MPLTPDEFYARRDDVQLAVMFFLKSNDLAYSVDEIVFELAGYGRHFPVERVQLALALLVRENRVEIGELSDGSIYYKYDRRLGFRPPRK